MLVKHLDDRLRPAPARPTSGATGAWPRSVGALLRLWPWIGSLIAAGILDLIIGALRHFDFTGIEGFSTTNYGWLLFSFVGGIGLAWRLARQPGRWWALIRPLVAAVSAFLTCFVAVTVMGLLFLPGQSLGETLTTDAPGRAFWLSVLVVIAAYVCEAQWALIRWARCHWRRPKGS